MSEHESPVETGTPQSSTSQVPTPAPPPAAADAFHSADRPPVTGPHYRNLLVAVALLVVVIGATLLLAPWSGGPARDPRSAPGNPDRTFLDLPLRQKPEQQPPAAPWWAQQPEPELPEEPNWYEPPPEPAPEPPPDPRAQAFERALRSASIAKADSVSPTASTPDEQVSPLGLPSWLPQLTASLPAPSAVAGEVEEGGVPGAGLAIASAHGRVAGPAPGVVASAIPVSLAAERLAAPAARTLRAGTLISARLETAINSDAPGPVLARVLRDVLDSGTGSQVLIPAGAQLLGSVSNQLAYGEGRVLVAFDRLSFPGGSYRLPGLEGLETSGARGLADQVDRHLWPTLGRAALLATVGAGFQLSQPDRSDRTGLSSAEVVAAQLGLELGRVAEQILSQGLSRRPTVRIRAGERFYVYLPHDLSL